MKKIKKWIPLLCITLLLLGSSLTVFASSSVPVPIEDSSYSYWIMVGKNDETEPYKIIYMKNKAYYDETSNNTGAVCALSDIAYSTFDDGVWSAFQYCSCRSFPLTLVYNENVLESNFDILYKDSNEIFFQQPTLISKQTKILKESVQNQTMIILPIALSCLALLIGSLTLLPRLRMYL